MANNCINRSSTEFKELAKVADTSDVILAAEIAVWQANNGVDRFPSMEELYPENEVTSVEEFYTENDVEEVYKKYSELTAIGTAKQYAQYLDTIFTDSKAKGIFILSTTFNLIKNTSKGIQSQIKKYRGYGGFLVSPSNTGHPYDANSAYRDYHVLINPRKEATDVGGNGNGKGGYAIAVEKRIHVLGTPNDITGFKMFVDNISQLSKAAELKEKLEQQASNSSIIDKNLEKMYKETDSSEKYVKGLANNKKDTVKSVEAKIERMRKIFGPDVIVLIDSDLDASGALLGTNSPISKQYPGKVVIVINPNKVFTDTVFHEFGHLYIDLLGGMSDPKVQDAVELLKSSKLWDEIEETYPELNAEQLAKEVVATALGLEAAEIYDKGDTRQTLWQQLKAFFYRILSGKIFKGNISPNGLESLANEMLTGKLRTTSASTYNTAVDQFSKYNLEDPTQENIDKLFKHFNKSLEVVEDKEMDARYYKDKETGAEYNNSVSRTASTIANKFSSTRKGVRDMKFDKAFKLTAANFESILHQPQIPWALDRALQDAFEGGSGFVMQREMPQNMYWYTWLLKLNRDTDGIFETGHDIIENNLKYINEMAKKLEDDKDTPLIAGTLVHESLEDYINERIDRLSRGDKTVPKFNPDILIGTKDDSEGVARPIDVIEKIDAIITKGIANGSKFYTEQKIFSQIAKRPGTIDLVEITKDGKHRIYDFKTTKSFTTYKGHKKSDLAMFGGEYLAQVLIYSTILQEYGIQAADDHLNILSIEILTENIDDNYQVTLLDTRFKTIDTRDYNFSRKIISYNTKILGLFKNPSKLSEFNFKETEKTLENLINKLTRATDDYKKLTNSRSGKFTNDSLTQQNKLIKQIEYDLADLAAEKNSAAVLSFIDNMKDAMHSVLNSMYENSHELSPEYLSNVDYILQVQSFTEDIKDYLEDQSIDFSIQNYTRTELLLLLQEIEETALQVRTSLLDNKKQMTIHTLAEHSTLFKGWYAEKYEGDAIEAYNAKNVKTNKIAFIKEFVFNKLQENEALIKDREYKYWANMMRNGYTDIRYMEHLLADPGMNKSQLVQIVKNILDKADQFTRYDTDESVRDIMDWHEGLTMPKTGDPRKIWGKFAIDAVFTDKDGVKRKHKSGILISKYTSDYREARLQEKHYQDDLERRILKAKQNNQPDKVTALIEHKAARREEFVKVLFKKSKVKRVNPDYTKLSSTEQKALDFIHKKLEQADERVLPSQRLVLEVKGGTLIHQLPKVRMTQYEAIYDPKSVFSRVGSAIKDLYRPPADEDDIVIGNSSDNFTSSTDVVGNASYNIPVFFRRELEEPELQSFDIPTLLAMNEETTISYANYRMVEPDLNVLTSTLKDVPVHKTDSVVNKMLLDKSPKGLTKHIKSERNLVLETINSSIENRLYKRTYKGVYSKTKYRLVKGAEVLNKNTGILLLAGNFKSASITGMQGTIYRMVEAAAGEDFNMKDVAKGSKKTWEDIANIISDSQSTFPKSKTNLLIRRFGLETQYSALVNKFVQDNFGSKNLDADTLYAVTGIAEKIVTASLMYTLMNNIKMLNRKGQFINTEGKVVSRDNAMSLDEAYIVKDGRLELNKHVTYTERNLTEEFTNSLYGEKTIAATQISSFIRSKYADMYGQYNQDMKSVAEMYVVGKLIFSMRKWLPRGMHRRWRGINTVWNTFDQMKEEDRIEERFYSQDQQRFQEGYYITTVRYFYTIFQKIRKENMKLSTAMKDTNNKLTIHERANMVRTISELLIIVASTSAAMLLRVMALKLGDDDEHKDKIYFAAYLAERISTESLTFLSIGEAIDIIRNPAASVNVLGRIADLFYRLIGLTIDEEGLTPNILEEYKKGNRKGELKVIKEIQDLVPFYKSIHQLKGIFGYETKSSIEDSFKFLIRQ